MPSLVMDSFPLTTAAAAAVPMAVPGPGPEECPATVSVPWLGSGALPRAVVACSVGVGAAGEVAFLVAAVAWPAMVAAVVAGPGVELAGPSRVGHAVGLASSSPVALTPSSLAEGVRERGGEGGGREHKRQEKC